MTLCPGFTEFLRNPDAKPVFSPGPTPWVATVRTRSKPVEPEAGLLATLYLKLQKKGLLILF